MEIGLSAILLLVLVLPFVSKKIEHNLEAFLFVMGVGSAVISRQLSWQLVLEAARDPVPIALAVLTFGLFFKWSRRFLDKFITNVLERISLKAFIFFLIIALGGIASVITAIISSLLLVEVICMLKLDKAHETRVVIISCFAIGLGAVLTPIGEPLSTIAIVKLKSWPDVNFWYLFKLLGWEVAGGVMALAVLSLFFHGEESSCGLQSEQREEKYAQVFSRAGKVYLFVMALVFLGQGFKPVIDAYVVSMPADALYWINMVSAALDNATLTAAEVSPMMTAVQVKKILMGLLISGGMLIPGNIPNIIAASKLGIKSRQWAKLGIPLGLATMLVFFILFKVV